MEMKINRRELLFVVVLAALTVALVAGLFEPFSDEMRERMQLEQTRGMPQDR